MTADQAARDRRADAFERRVAARAALDARRSLETAHRLLRGGAHTPTADEWRQVVVLGIHARTRIEQLIDHAVEGERAAAERESTGLESSATVVAPTEGEA